MALKWKDQAYLIDSGKPTNSVHWKVVDYSKVKHGPFLFSRNFRRTNEYLGREYREQVGHKVMLPYEFLT